MMEVHQLGKTSPICLTSETKMDPPPVILSPGALGQPYEALESQILRGFVHLSVGQTLYVLTLLETNISPPKGHF